MRIALVSPYSWTYPGGVTRHVRALAEQFIERGHDVEVLAPFDPPGRRSRRLHRGDEPEHLEPPPYLVDLGRTVGLHANGARSNLMLAPSGIFRLREQLRSGDYDVVHIHEPIAPTVSWDAVGVTSAPLVGTFHTYSTNSLTNNLGNIAGARRRFQRLHVRIAVSRAAEWTGLRYFGGRYRVIPNGVALPDHVKRSEAVRPTAARPLRIAFVGQAVERKGLPVALLAFAALREHLPAEFTIIGADAAKLDELVGDRTGIMALGKVTDEEKMAVLASSDLLVASSLGGESFGMVLTEAFAAGTPVVASDIAGYTDVVSDGVDGVLFPRGDAQALANVLLGLADDPARRSAMSLAAAAKAERYAWPQVADEVLAAYADAIAMPKATSVTARVGITLGLRSADLGPRVPAQRRLASLERDTRTRPERIVSRLRRVAVVAALGGILAACVLAIEKIGPGRIGSALVTSRPSWLLLAFALMCAAMASRGVAWHAILRAALPGSWITRGDAMRGTFIGVLMSATLPARLGEPARSLVVARRAGRPAEAFPVVLGTIVSQTLLNLLALAILGTIMFASANVFSGRHAALAVVAIGPAAVALIVVLAPLVLRRRGDAAGRRVELFRARLHDAVVRVRAGLRVFREPRLGATAAAAQLAAWALQCASCYTLLVALGLDRHAGVAAAAGVLFAVNVTAVLPAAPSNIGIFQAACVAVLAGAFHVSTPAAIAYGIVLQIVEISTAVVMGVPALLREGLSWRDVRLRAMHATPITLNVAERGPLEQTT